MPEALRVAGALLAAAAGLHRWQRVYLSINPWNVLLSSGGASEGAALREGVPPPQLPAEGTLEGNPEIMVAAPYLSPEQAGLIAETVDARSDLYSIGVVLFECLAGHLPFEGATLKAVWSQQLSDSPPSLRTIGLRVPRAVDEMVRRLLRQDPRDRYQSARAARIDCAAIEEKLGSESDPDVVIGRFDHRQTLAEPAFVGRRDEVARFAMELESARVGAGRPVLLEGESGAGKSRLLAEMAWRSAQEGALVLRGNGVDRAAQRPFQVLDGVVGGVLEAAVEDPLLAQRLREHLGAAGESVSAALPAMADVLGPPSRTALPEEFGEARSLNALSALLDALGTTDRPAVVLIDDFQWADELSVKLLDWWQRNAQLPTARHVLLVASFRSEEVGAVHPLRAVPAATRLVLAPLPATDLRRLAESMAGPLPEEALATVEHLSAGSPLMASAVLSGLIESNALVFEPARWRFVRTAMAEVSSSRWAAAYLTRRLKDLPATERRLLLGGAVLGKEFDLELAAQLAKLSPKDAQRAIEEARRRHLVWRERTGWAFVHDKVREGLLAMLADDERRALHLDAALRLEQRQATDKSARLTFDLAYHFDAAGQSERAFPFAWAAAQQARAQNALEVASRQYRIAERGARSLDVATRQRVAEGLGEVEMLHGRYDEAEQHLESARDLATSDLRRATVEGKLGELAFKRGEVKVASTWIEQALRRLGQRVPRDAAAFWIFLCWEVAIQLLHTLLPRLFLARRRTDRNESALQTIRLYSRLAYAYWFERGKVPCGWAHLREMNLAERYPPGPELAQAYSEHAPVCTMVPLFRRGIVYAEKSLLIRRTIGDIWGQGQSLHFFGVVLYGASRFKECIEKCEEAVRFLERTGDRWEVNTARGHIAYALYRLGRLNEAVEVARSVHEAGIAIGDHQASGISLSIWSKATGGKLPVEPIASSLTRPSDDLHTAAEVAQAEAIRLLAAGDAARSAALLEEAWRRVRKRGLRQEYVSPILPWWAQALRCQAERVPAWDPRTRRSILRRAKSVARDGVGLARWYRSNLPQALRERALIFAAVGKTRRCRTLLRKSLELAMLQGARYERALTLVELGRLGRAFGWPEAEAQEKLAEQELQVIRPAAGTRPVTLSLMNRFAGVIDLGRRIASTHEPSAVYAAVHSAAMDLLRGQRVVVVELRESAAPLPVAGDPELALSKPMLQRALAEARPIVADRTAENPSLLLPAQVRSALCAPIFVRGRPAACLFVVHDVIERLFREEEHRLAQFITTLAGAALENAAGFAEIEALSRSLEQRVTKRTAELEAAMERTESARSLLQASLEATADGILVVDRSGRIVQFNDQFAKMWHIPSTILARRDDAQAIVHVQAQLKDPRAFYAKVRELYAHPEAESEDILEFNDGRTFSRTSKPQRLGGECVGRVWSFRDITAEKEFERQLRRSKRELEIEFRQAQTASRLKSEFLANMSHEVRTPLNSIIGFAQLIHDGKLGPVSAQHREFLDDILTSAHHLLQLINDVLDLARVEAGKLTLRPERVNLASLVGEVQDVLRALATQRNMRIDTAIDDALDDVVTDPGRLKQILYNYLSNALKFAQGERVFVRLRALSDEEFSIEVEDQGPGIRGEDLRRLFVEFQQLDASASKRHGGTGLGLALTKQLVEAQGGRVGVRSTLGRGSTFFAVLPRHANVAREEERTFAPEPSHGP